MKKLLATLLASTMAFAAIGGLVACGGGDEEKEVAATGIKMNKATLTLSPDESASLLAALTPTGANQDVVWTSSNPAVAIVNGGANGANIALVSALDTGKTTITAKVGKYETKCEVTVGDWTKFMLVGSINGWDSEDASEEWLFTQDATDKHLWTTTVNLTKDDIFKIVTAKKNEDGKFQGTGWNTENGMMNLGINEKEPAEDKDQMGMAEGGNGVLNIHNDGGSGNIKVDTDGSWTFTLRTVAGGGFKSLEYKYNGPAAE